MSQDDPHDELIIVGYVSWGKSKNFSVRAPLISGNCWSSNRPPKAHFPFPPPPPGGGDPSVLDANYPPD